MSAAAILTLAIASVGSTMMFALVRGVLLRPLPVHDQDRVIVAWKELRTGGNAHHPFGDLEIDAAARASRLLEMVAGVDANGSGRQLITEGGESSYVKSALVAGPFFQVLDVDAVLGRPLTREDDVDGAENVVAISHGLWTRRYGRSRDVVGRRITLGEDRFTIVGVMPPDVDYPSGVEVWRTTHSVSTKGPFGDAARREVDLIGRLRPGVTIEQARSELIELTRQAASTGPATARGVVPIVRSLEEVIVGNARSPIVALMAAVALVLLLASANVANLLLMRGEARRVELAVREALGATRSRIARQVFLESLMLALTAASIGLIASWWTLPALLHVLPDAVPRIESVRVDAPVVLFTVLTAFVAAGLAGLAPVLAMARADLLSSIRSGGRGAAGAASTYGRRVLVIAQVALAMIIVSGGGLLMRSVLRLQAVDTGFSASDLILVELSLPQSKYADRVRHGLFLEQAMAALETLPAVASATPVNAGPYSADGGWDVPRFTAEGQSDDRAASNPSLNLESIYPNYFTTFGISIVSGRAFSAEDRERTLPVAILSEEVAAAMWSGANAVGKRIKVGGPGSREPWLTVVGVAAPTRYRELATGRPTLYLPAAQFLVTAQTIVLRTHASAGDVANAARDRMKAVDPDVLVARVVPFSRMLDIPLARPRFSAFLLGIFGVAALLLSAVGLYAVIATSVRQRDREIAVRIALGATLVQVRRLVLGEAVWLGGCGALLGLMGAMVATRTLRGFLYGIDVLDPATLAAAVLLSLVTSMLASYVPMLRATRTDAIAALRT